MMIANCCCPWCATKQKVVWYAVNNPRPDQIGACSSCEKPVRIAYRRHWYGNTPFPLPELVRAFPEQTSQTSEGE